MSDAIPKISANSVNGNNVTPVMPSIISNKERDVERGDVSSRVGGLPANRSRPTSASSTPTSVQSAVGTCSESEREVSSDVLPGSQDSESTRGRRWKAVGRLLWRLVLVMLVLGTLAVGLALLAYYTGPIFLVQLTVVVAVAYFVAGGRLRWFYVALRTLPRDVKAILLYIRVLWFIRGHQKKDRSVADVFRQHVSRYPNKACFVFEDQEWTFQEIEDFSNKIANVFRSHGYRKGDVVALLLENRPEFVAIWLGLSKLGVITPLINTNLRKSSLLHCIHVAQCQAFIYGIEFTDAVTDIASSLDAKLAHYRFGDHSDSRASILREKNLNILLNDASSMPPVLQEKGCFNDKLLYIYTSGTTGLPKAAVITSSRFMFITSAIQYLAILRATDRLYTPLPLYHTAGGVMAVGQALLYGNTTVIRKKFSASAYFNDCIKYRCTVAQYIGEMCRYILAVPPKPEDKQHNVRVIVGNGLRPQIWKEFVNRFNIAKVAEFYGATEGNANIVNVDNTVGAIGFVSRIIPSVYPISIIKVNADGEPIRNEKGLCQICGANEPGVFVGKIIPNNPSRAFLGYVDQNASKSKIVYDVFTKGDSAFLSGDILVADELGYLYFKDRTGDTFRWKGENVSTSEIEGIVSNLVNYRDCIVYGVEVSGSEGRAGMAAIHDESGFLNIERLAINIKGQLPAYARPQFIRILTKVDLTGTFKLKKKDLQQEGYDPRRIRDKLYYLDPKMGYQVLTPEVYDQIQHGKIRF